VQNLSIFKEGLWKDVIDIWTSGQVGLPEVERWSVHASQGSDHGGIRKQNSLQHSYSITLLGSMLIRSSREYIAGLDEILLLNSLLVHDHGEGELGRDIVAINKNENADLEEYNAFCSRFKQLPKYLFNFYHEAFLLQFALAKPNSFPPKARSVMAYLKKFKKMECLLFEFIERWDYLVYALEQYSIRGNERILVNVLRPQSKRFNQLAKEIPGARELVWTKEAENWANNFLSKHEGKWEE